MLKILIGAGILFILVGLAWLIGERFGLGRLPGDFVIEGGASANQLQLIASSA